MKEKRNCKIIQDLLPNYIENLTNEETNYFIEEHLKECPECQKVLANMQKEIKVNATKRDDREVKYIKKYSNKLKILKYALLIIILIYVIVVGRRTIIMTSLSGKANENQIYDNYYARLYSYQGDTLTITESYNKGKDYLTTLTRMVNGNEIQKITYYKKGNEQLFITESDGKKNVLDSETMLGGTVLPVTYVSDGLLANLQYAFITGIDSTYCNGKECYIVKGNSYERYIDKETGLAVRSIEKSNKEITRKTDMVVDYEYKFNIVKDNDIVKPDTTSYIENNK
ncbi:MAG: zf-HC2 domain-containing protein [Clostridia bacterium]